MSSAGRRRRGTSSIAPSPTSSSSPSGRPEPRPSQLPQWKFSQVLGDLPPAAAAGRGNGPAALQDAADEISAIEFDARGEYLAAGDHAGRVILFRRADEDEARPQARPRAELERADRAGVPPPPRYSFATEFQSHEPEFDVLHSLEIGEKIKRVRWCARPNRSLCMLATNDRTVKLWKVSEHKAPKKGDGEPRRRSTSTAASLPLREPRSERATTKPRGSSADSAELIEKVGDVGDGYSAKCRRVFDRAHEFNINSISNNCDGETFVSADDLRINLWHLEVTSQCFNIVDLKPADMQDLVEVITTAEFHPSSCSLLAYGSSSGRVRLVDLRRSALCDQSVRTFRDREGRPQPSTFFTEIISCITDLKFTGEGRYLLTRDYMNLKLWDMRVGTSPVATYKVHEFLRPKLSELYTEDYIFDRFSCCASKDGSYFATGSYRFSLLKRMDPDNTFKVFSRTAVQTTGTTLEASANPYRVQPQTSAKIPALLSNFSLGVSRKGQDSLRSDGKEEIPCNLASRVTHLAWHPTENFIVCAANNSLYMYHT
ncbi:serine/threonine protein phosphatase 2A 55 kDa regulatory subunit B beta isoform-like isoform X1 [Panicum hallii]|uniref:serine/threonine protein phosphatase 2A 55 kDa regulatory subunit B beta isoform-like isoform X1 n=1 Tax=Panicum hallii TaxID=206008 RepID=UPI000DF4EFFF|nr:serine/threonine protein phosphatase 2A 55 kDa regulatory subunit B beta isoform-like isoform X1 [Panicum hallii]